MFQVTADVMVPNCLTMWRYRLPWKRLYLKNELQDFFYCGKVIRRMKLSARFKKIIWSRFRATLKFSSCEGGSESAPEKIL